jgi:hypothetical protein
MPVEPVGPPVQLGQFLREQFEEDLLRDWHLPDCQKFRPVPPGLRDSFFLRGGFSCNCELASWMYRQYTSKIALLEACEREIEAGVGVLLARAVLHGLARPYDKHPQYDPDRSAP